MLARFRASPNAPLQFVEPPEAAAWSRAQRQRVDDSRVYVTWLLRHHLLRRSCLQPLFARDVLQPDMIYSVYFQCADESVTQTGSCAYDVARTDACTVAIPDVHFFLERGYGRFALHCALRPMPWAQREARAFWRGSTTGRPTLDLDRLQRLPRYQLCALALKHATELDAGFTDIVQACTRDEHVRIQAHLAGRGMLKAWHRLVDFRHYRYLVELDGNAAPWGFLKKLLTGSCVLRVASDRWQWFYSRLVPWQHYVPVRADLSDLIKQIRWCQENDGSARRIAAAGQAFARQLRFRKEMREASRHIARVAQRH